MTREFNHKEITTSFSRRIPTPLTRTPALVCGDMANWRELGCVPNSDDEDFSDGELSTQEEPIVEDHTSDTEDQNAADLGSGDAAVEVKEVDETEEIEVVTVRQMVSEEMTTSLKSSEVCNFIPYAS